MEQYLELNWCDCLKCPPHPDKSIALVLDAVSGVAGNTWEDEKRNPNSIHRYVANHILQMISP